MQRNLVSAAVVALAALGFATPTTALGPVDGEVGAVWWASDHEVSSGSGAVSEGADAPGFRAELWFYERYGVRASLFSAEPDSLTDTTSDYTSLDVMWRAFSPTENNFVAIGAGWEDMDLATVGLDGSTSGARVSAEGRLSAGIAYFYAQGSWQPALDDAPAEAGLGRFENLEGKELEAGASVTVFPFMALRAGFRMQDVDFTFVDPVSQETDGNVETAGWFAGLTVRF
jgi:hypothetical protein